jgi:sulfite oxidase
MASKKERSASELYRDDPERADAEIFGRRADSNARGFAEGAGLAAVAAVAGGRIVHAAAMPSGLAPVSLPPALAGKTPGLLVLQDLPLVAETPEHLLDDATTPIDRFFVRNNGLEAPAAADPDSHAFLIDGEVQAPLRLTVGDLKARFRAVTYRLQLECGGNGRSFFSPPTRGNPWGNGAIGCAEWTGITLADVLRAAGLKDSAVHTGHYGADPHTSGDTSRPSISRGIPIAKAMERHTLIAFAMNGEPLPHAHGGPLRLVVPGWPGSVSHKWLTRIWVRDQVHDGVGMGGTSYRIPTAPLPPGAEADGKTFVDLTSMPVRSILTSHANGARLAAGTRTVAVRGAAWAGDHDVARVAVSTDFGRTWQNMRLAGTRNRYDWRRWSGSVSLPADGYYEVWVRAEDTAGNVQPHAAGNWNPQGYGGNAFHRVALLVG